MFILLLAATFYYRKKFYTLQHLKSETENKPNYKFKTIEHTRARSQESYTKKAPKKHTNKAAGNYFHQEEIQYVSDNHDFHEEEYNEHGVMVQSQQVDGF